MLKRAAPYIPFIVMLLLHLPFLQADPDSLLAWHSRGAWTDEGLYTAQIRNYISSGHFDINQMDGFAKAPLFSLFLLPFLYLFGSHLWVARLAILVFSLVTTQQLIKRCFAGIPSYWAWGIIGLQYLVFTYSHFAMAEMLGASCIVWAGIFYLKYAHTQNVKHALYEALWLLAAFCCKTNYAYCLAILPVCISIMLISNLINRQSAQAKQNGLVLIYTTALYALFLLALYALVYLPNQEVYTKILTQDVAEKLESGAAKIATRVSFNLHQLTGGFALLSTIVIAAISALVYAFIKLYKKPITPRNYLILFAGVWLFLELHKLFIQNLPSRYLVSTFLCLSILIAALCAYAYQHQYKTIAWGMAGIIILINGAFYVKAYTNRSFQIQTINTYLAATANSNRTVLGTWAPTACWESKNVTLPVWEGYFNDTGFMEKFHPQAIITEVDERDAGYIFTKRGVNLKAQSDSIRVFPIGEWQVAVHWMKE